MPENLHRVEQVHQRATYEHKFGMMNIIQDGEMLSRVVAAVNAYNAGDKSPESSYVNLFTDPDTGISTIQVRPRTSRTNPGENIQAEIDFGSGSDGEIRTHDIVKGYAALTNITQELEASNLAETDAGTALSALLQVGQIELYEQGSAEQKKQMDIISAIRISEDEIESTPDSIPTSKTINVKGTVAAAMGDTKTGRQVVDVNVERFAIRQLGEDSSKWNVDEEMKGQPWYKRWGKKAQTTVERMWRSATNPMQLVKEKSHGYDLYAASGIEGDFTAEALRAIDAEARVAIKEERKGVKKFTGAVRDFFSELTVRQTDLHKKRVEITAAHRKAFNENPLDKNNPLFDMIMADVKGREETAMRIAEATTDTLHMGEHQAVGIHLEKDSPVYAFLTGNIFKRAIADGLSHDTDPRISPELRQTLDLDLREFFLTDQFQEWRSKLPQEQRDALANSLTYSTDILNQLEGVIIPTAIDIHKQGTAIEDIDFNIDLTLGTAQFGPNGTIPSEGLFSSERAVKLDERAWADIRKRGEKALGSGKVASGITRAYTLAFAESAMKNEWLGATAGVLGVNLLKTGLRGTAGVLAPFAAGGIAGLIAGYKEYASLNRKRVEVNVERALGYERAANAVKHQELAQRDYYMVDMGDRAGKLTSQILALGETPTAKSILELLGMAADSAARVRLGDAMDINLLKATSVPGTENTPAARALYQSQVRLHDQARGIAVSKAIEILSKNDALRKEVADSLGLGDVSADNADQIFDTLRDTMIDHLSFATTISEPYKVALGAHTIEKAQAIENNDKAFKSWRNLQALKKGAIVGLTAGVLTGAVQYFRDAHEEIVTTGTETINQTVVDVSKPLHEGATIANFVNPETNESIAMHAHIPAGTHLDVITQHLDKAETDITSYNLVADDGKIILSDLRFQMDGTPIITERVKAGLLEHNGAIIVEPQPKVEWFHEIVTPVPGTEDVVEHATKTENLINMGEVGDLPGFEQGWQGYFRAMHPDATMPQQVGWSNFLRAYQLHIHPDNDNAVINQIPDFPRTMKFAESIHGPDLIAARGQAPNMEISLPDLFASQDGQDRVSNFIAQSISDHDAGKTLTAAQQIAYDMAVKGGEHDIPDLNETQTLLDALGYGAPTTETIITAPTEVVTQELAGSFTPNEVYINFTEDITVPTVIEHKAVETISDILPIAIAAGYERGLEASLDSKTRYNPLPNIPSPIPSVIPSFGGYEYLNNHTSRKTKRRLPDGSFSYYSPVQDTEHWKRTRSETLNLNPSAKLDQLKEIDDYFRREGAEWSERIQKLNSTISSPMSNSVRGVVCIPIAAVAEADNITTTLEMLSQQDNVSGDEYEIILYSNWMKSADKAKVAETNRRILKFIDEHKNIPIRLITDELSVEPKDFKIGYVMKTANDIALERIRVAGIENDVMLTVLPADVKGLSRQFIAGLVENASKDKDVYTSPIDFGTEYYPSYPGFHVAIRALEAIIRVSESNYPGPVFTSGSGLQKKASILAAVGGYNEQLGMGEDAEIGMKVVAARLGNKEEFLADEFPIGRSYKTWNEVDPARLLSCYKQGQTILAAWSDFTENGYKVRPENTLSGVESIKEDWDRIIERLENQLTALNNNYPPELINRSFNLILLPGTWIREQNGSIKITESGKSFLKEELESYADNNYQNVRYASRGTKGQVIDGTTDHSTVKFDQTGQVVDTQVNLGDRSVFNTTDQRVGRRIDLGDVNDDIEITGNSVIVGQMKPGLAHDVRKQKFEQSIPASVQTQEDKVAYLVHQNKTLGTDNFIEKERAILAQSGTGNWSEATKDTEWLTNKETSAIAENYNIPMAYIFRGNHAYTVIRAPERVVGGYNLAVYDPFHDGERTIKVTDQELADGNSFEPVIYFAGFPEKIMKSTNNYQIAKDIMEANNYDLTFPSLPPGKEWYLQAKSKGLQNDDKNCTLWSIFHAAVAWAMKPGHNEFKDNGAKKFEQETGMHLLQYEDVVG